MPASMSSTCPRTADRSMDGATGMQFPTRQIAAWIGAVEAEPLSPRAQKCARHALLDWAGVTIAAADDPLVDRLVKIAIEDDETGNAGLAGRGERLTPTFAALVNGAASHALDYDDINTRMRGHPTVAVVPALLAISSTHNPCVGDLLDALAAGVEVACVVGEMMGHTHYNNGFHNTGTIGTIAAAAGAARLMRLSPDRTETALGLAATQAAGLKAMFGSMAKPLHAGKAAMNGLLSARWARSGVTATNGVLECDQGFGQVLSGGFSPKTIRREPGAPFGIEQNIFKFHAACYYVHSALEAASDLAREHGFKPDDVEAIEVGLMPELHKVCDILEPRTGLEVKFSIRHMVALRLFGRETGDPSIYTDDVAIERDLVALRSRIQVVLEDFDSRTTTRVSVTHSGNQTHTRSLDVGVPADDLDRQEERLVAKFNALTEPRLGRERARALRQAMLSSPINAPASTLTDHLFGS